MKIFISIDIEGITTTSFWPETTISNETAKAHVAQMNKELLAACNGAIKAGATQITIRDAHEFANNIDQSLLPECASIIRGWSGHPYSMVDGVDSSYDGAIFIGYHSAASKGSNPLSHTESLAPLYVKLNGEVVGEFELYSFACIMENVPVLFLSGDKALCEEASKIYPDLTTCPVKEGKGASTLNYNVSKTLKQIELKAEQCVKNAKNVKNPKLADSFELEVCYKDHTKAEKFSYFPGVKKISGNTVQYKTNDYFEVLRTFAFIFG